MARASDRQTNFSILDEKRKGLERAKSQGVKTSRAFERFFVNSETVDEILRHLLIYMIAKFQWMGCEHLVAKAKIVNDKTKENEAYRCVGHRTAPDFRADMRAAVDAIRPLYAQILIKCSDYSNTHKDRLFFEAFYATLGYTCISVLSNHQGGNRGPQIDGDGQESIMSKMVQIDVGGIFRTNYYNMPRRVEGQTRVIDMLTCSQLYQLRHVEKQVNMSAELATSLNERPRMSSKLHESFAATSGLVSKLLNRTSLRKSVTSEKHMEQTNIEMLFDPPPADSSKSSSLVPASSTLELEALEDKRGELIRLGQPKLTPGQKIMAAGHAAMATNRSPSPEGRGEAAAAATATATVPTPPLVEAGMEER